MMLGHSRGPTLQISAGKRIAFSVVPILAVLATLEVASAIVLSAHGSNFAASALDPLTATTKADSHENNEDRFTPDSQILHPYLGAALAPKPHEQFVDGKEMLANYGFGHDSGPFFSEPEPDKVHVGIFGGSVAKQFLTHGKVEELFEELSKLPQFAGKEFVANTPSNYGYKQPQSQLALQYMLAVGAHYDVILLIDGFNEVAMPKVENINFGSSAYYPRMWSFRMQNLDHVPSVRRTIAKIALYQERLELLAANKNASAFHRTNTARLANLLYSNHLVGKLIDAQEQMYSHQDAASDSYVVSGPASTYSSDAAMMQDFVDVWARGSQQMYKTAAANGMFFIHVLQPNQYVKNSKILTPEERAVAIDEWYFRTPAIELGYPLLQAAGQNLRAAGVPFYDMTMAFADTDEPFYVDRCCHINTAGNAYLAKKIGEAVVADYLPRQ